MAARQNDLRLYLDFIPDPAKVDLISFFHVPLFNANLQPDPAPQTIMIFLKHFDTSRQTLLGAGKQYVSRTSKVGDLVPLINERMRLPTGTNLRLYEVG
jgi:ubiquitin carboxyl-terminal hydrolase 7